jgi:hypothetical protein
MSTLVGEPEKSDSIFQMKANHHPWFERGRPFRLKVSHLAVKPGFHGPWVPNVRLVVDVLWAQ